MTNSDSAARMAEAAAAFLAGLDAGQQGIAGQPFDEDGDARRDWHYIPRTRPGLSFRDMTADQQKAAYELLASGLAPAAFAATTTIIGLEDVLDEIEGRARHRHRADYSTTVFGDPLADEWWGWRFEGHHVSVNVTLAGGEIASTPLFLGANPAEVVGASGRAVTRPLAAEEDLALELVDRLDPEQRDEAMLGPDAPDDILTAAAPRLDELPVVAGLRFAKLSGSTESLAEALVRLYLDRLPPPVAEKRWARLRPIFGDVRFAFAGTAEHRRPHYYRLTGPSLFVEYDNTQDGANHVHSVLRDPEGDFGDDLLRAHRRLQHGV